MIIYYYLFVSNMPTVTITMSEKAYEIYRNWSKGQRSMRTSSAILQWEALKDVKWSIQGDEE